MIRNNYESLFDPNINRAGLYYDKTIGSTGHALKYARTQDEKEYAMALKCRSKCLG